MKLTTKRNWRYFWRELFSYMIPMILIVGTIDVFYHFMQCPLHPEWSAPCSVNWILAAIYGAFLIITIILAIISANMLRKVKRQIENEFLESTTSAKKIEEKPEELKVEDVKKVNTKPKKVIVKAEPINLKKTSKKEAGKGTKEEAKTGARKKTTTKKTSTKK